MEGFEPYGEKVCHDWIGLRGDSAGDGPAGHTEQKTISQVDFAPDQINYPGSTSDFMTSMDVQQPLLIMDQVFQRRAAGAEAEVYRLKGRRAIEDVVYETRKAYMQQQLAHRVQHEREQERN